MRLLYRWKTIQLRSWVSNRKGLGHVLRWLGACEIVHRTGVCRTFATLEHPQLGVVRPNSFQHIPTLVGGVALEPGTEWRGGRNKLRHPVAGGCWPRDT